MNQAIAATICYKGSLACCFRRLEEPEHETKFHATSTGNVSLESLHENDEVI